MMLSLNNAFYMLYNIAKLYPMPLRHCILLACATIVLFACKHFKPKPVSDDITKTTVTIGGKKDSVINNPEKNYGNATVSSICVKCLLGVIQNTDSYRQLTAHPAQKNIVYDVNWITSKTPVAIGRFGTIVNGMQVAVNENAGGLKKTLTTYLYNNENAAFYLKSGDNSYNKVLNADSVSLQKVRRSCFWGVASDR